METFDFDGTAPQNATFDSGFTLSVTGTVQDINPAPGVSFTLSASGTYATEVPNGNGLAAILDFTGPGFRVVLVSETSTIVSNTFGVPGLTFTTSPPSEAFLTFNLNTTPNRTAFDTGSAPVLLVNGETVTGTVTPDGSAIRFTISDPETSLNISQLTAGFTCFCAGTRVTTPDGVKNVEDLRPGDLVCLANGRVAPVRWLGRQVVNSSVAHPAEANPIRITRGAMGHGLPERDLRVSKDHAICIDGVLINAGCLVNGSTIYQESNVREAFTYYHVETDAHELILAEGVATETFVDQTTRDTFENAHEAPDRVIPEMPLPRISSARLVPDHIKRKLRPLIAAE